MAGLELQTWSLLKETPFQLFKCHFSWSCRMCADSVFFCQCPNYKHQILTKRKQKDSEWRMSGNVNAFFVLLVQLQRGNYPYAYLNSTHQYWSKKEKTRENERSLSGTVLPVSSSKPFPSDTTAGCAHRSVAMEETEETEQQKSIIVLLVFGYSWLSKIDPESWILLTNLPHRCLSHYLNWP